MVDRFAHLGLSISKDRLLQMSTSLGNASIETFERDGVCTGSSSEKPVLHFSC